MITNCIYFNKLSKVELSDSDLEWLQEYDFCNHLGRFRDSLISKKSSILGSVLYIILCITFPFVIGYACIMFYANNIIGMEFMICAIALFLLFVPMLIYGMFVGLRRALFVSDGKSYIGVCYDVRVDITTEVYGNKESVEEQHFITFMFKNNDSWYRGEFEDSSLKLLVDDLIQFSVDNKKHEIIVNWVDTGQDYNSFEQSFRLEL